MSELAMSDYGNNLDHGNGSAGRFTRTAVAQRDVGDDSRGVVLLVTVSEAARILRLGRSKTYELIAAGALEVVHIGRCCRVPVDSVEAYVDRLRRG
ncbi:MAG TPA: helix-turn-helix domain-containing protein [Acidimicrobiales bacterium]|nr:helix-turn-helix domain-containing protein [Acidimicrobiales bacterium]